MITLKEFIEIDSEAKAIRKKIEPENTRLGEIAHLKEEFNGNLTWDVKTFISQKLWDNMDSSTKEKVQAYRDELDKMLNPPKNELAWATTEGGGSHGSYSISAIQKGSQHREYCSARRVVKPNKNGAFVKTSRRVVKDGTSNRETRHVEFLLS